MTVLRVLITLFLGLGSLIAFFVGIIGIGSAFFPDDNLETDSRVRVAFIGIGFLVLSVILGRVAL